MNATRTGCEPECCRLLRLARILGRYATRQAIRIRAIEDIGNLVVPAVVLYEVCKKVRRKRGEDAALQVAATMESGRIIEIDARLALEASRLDMPLADSLIYATTSMFDATLWTQDADFAGLERVRYFKK